MRSWTRQPADRFALHWPVGLQLRDDLTNELPVQQVNATLFRHDGGTLVRTAVPFVCTPGGVLTYPALERRAGPTSLPPTDYQVRLSSAHYLPLYRASASGIDFRAFPYDDTTAPAGGPPAVLETRLLPSPGYPFPGHFAVLRGMVTVDAEPAADVLVSWMGLVHGTPLEDRTLSDERGSFALPLRWAPPGAGVRIHARHAPPGGSVRTASIDVTLPDDLTTSQTIAIT